NEATLRIAIDIDDVLADSLPEFLEAFNRRFGLQVSVTEAGWEIFRRHPEIPPEEIRAFFAQLYQADFLGSRPLLPGAREGVERLHREGHRLFIITGRLQHDRDITERWLMQRGLSSFFQEVVYRDGIHAPLHKRRAAERLRPDVLLEDEYEVALAAAELPVRVLVFDRPWNQGPLPSRVFRIRSWPDVFPFLGQEAGLHDYPI
ncbi:MAG: HAD family hydrolase, partial [Candidatus Methylomirabilales bacterium]